MTSVERNRNEIVELKIDASDVKLDGYELELILNIENTIPVYFDTHSIGKIAWISMNPITKKPYIVVDRSFTKLSEKTKEFVLYHEIGHYVNDDFRVYKNNNNIINNIKEIIKFKFFNKFPDKELHADYYAMYKIDSLKDSITAINEIYDIGIDELNKKELKIVNKHRKSRITSLTKLFHTGKYYINE